MPKIILENKDIIDLINMRYPGAEVVSGLDENFELIIRVDNTIPRFPPPLPPPRKEVLLPDGSIDAEKSGLTLEKNGTTRPGKNMLNKRGNLPIF